MDISESRCEKCVLVGETRDLEDEPSFTKEYKERILQNSETIFREHFPKGMVSRGIYTVISYPDTENTALSLSQCPLTEIDADIGYHMRDCTSMSKKDLYELLSNCGIKTSRVKKHMAVARKRENRYTLIFFIHFVRSDLTYLATGFYGSHYQALAAELKEIGTNIKDLEMYSARGSLILSN